MKLEKFYDKVYDWVLIHGLSLLIGIFLFFSGLWLIRLLKSHLRNRMSQRNVHSSLQPFFLSLTITGLNILLIIAVMQIIGLQLTIFTTVIGAFSVAIGLALSGTLQNFAGGVLILLLRPFEIDDFIIAQGQEGKVSSIQLFFTVVLTPENKTVIIPNGKLFNEVIVNVSREGTRRLDFDIKLGYVIEVDQVKEAIDKCIKMTPGILQTPATRVGIIKLELDGITFTIRVWVEPDDYLVVKIALQEAIVKELRAAGIKLPGT